MTIDLEPESSSASYASVKLDKEGDVWVGMLIDYDPKTPLYKFRPINSTAPRTRELSPDGKEKTQDLLTVLLMNKTNCRVRMPREPGQTQGDDVVGDAAAGAVARVYIKGHNRWTEGRADSFREAKQKHGNFQVGDVVWGKVTSIEDVGANEPKKVVSFGMRKPKPEEAALVQRCVDEYQRLKAVDLEPATSSGGGPPDDDLEPF